MITDYDSDRLIDMNTIKTLKIRELDSLEYIILTNHKNRG